MRARALFLVALAGGAWNANASQPVAASNCQPSYVFASDKPQEVRTAFAIWTVQALLIGCRNEVETLTPADKAKVTDIIAAIVKKEDFGLIGRTTTREFRDALAKQINAAIGRKVVSDVAFLRASRGEPN